ncbi:MAG TPA: hypothetical protein VGK17_21450 [Propionicimonas sp.]|jgi:hypothetical protein
MSAVKDGTLMTTIEFVKVLDAGVRDLNGRKHRSLGRKRGIATDNPLDTWAQAGVTLPVVDEEHIALALLRRDEVTVKREGVELNGMVYQGPATFTRVGDRLQAGWLATRPDFIELLDPSRPLGEQWLGRLEISSVASTKYAQAVRDARTFQIETVERADRRADELRAEKLAQLRGGVVDAPGASPTAPRRPKASRSVAPNVERTKRVAVAPIWKEAGT